MTLEILIAGLAVPKFAYFMAWAFLGQLMMIAKQIKKYIERIKDQGGFQIAYWWKNNWLRLVISFFIALPFSPIAVLVAIKAPDGLTELTCVGIGAIIDQYVEAFTNKKKP